MELVQNDSESLFLLKIFYLNICSNVAKTMRTLPVLVNNVFNEKFYLSKTIKV